LPIKRSLAKKDFSLLAYTLVHTVFIPGIRRSGLKKLKVPVLALWGSKDLTSTTCSENRQPVENALIKSGVYYETFVFDSMNHLFQKAVTGGIAEYASIPTTIEPEVLEKMVEFIKKR
jgi:pimeloyl-ACP methyl ester carboxylesterase